MPLIDPVPSVRIVSRFSSGEKEVGDALPIAAEAKRSIPLKKSIVRRE